MKYRTLLQASEPGLHELILNTYTGEGRAKVVALRRLIAEVSNRIVGQSRRREGDQRSWAEIVLALHELVEIAPPELAAPLAQAEREAVGELKRLADTGACNARPCQYARVLLRGRPGLGGRPDSAWGRRRTKSGAPIKTIKGTLKAVDAKTRKLAGRASSTQPDRDDDDMSVKALQQMRKDIIGLPVLLDHVYKIDNVVGRVTRATLVERDGYTDLDVVVELLPEGDRGADKAWALVEQGVQIGLSVGVLVHDATPKKNGRSYTFNEVEIIELSIVVVPSQRRSQGLQPVKSKGARTGGNGDRRSFKEKLMALANAKGRPSVARSYWRLYGPGSPLAD
jgi:hypothetical protein